MAQRGVYMASFCVCLTTMLLLQAAAAQKASPVPAPAPVVSSGAEYLTGHNAARAKVGVPALTWSTALQTYAAKYVAAQSAANTCRQLVNSGGPYGENKFWGSGKAWTPGEAVAAWVATGQYYNAALNACVSGNEECHEYTQVVWRSTTSLGCASTVCPDASTIVMCSYYPPGNIIGQRPF